MSRPVQRASVKELSEQELWWTGVEGLLQTLTPDGTLNSLCIACDQLLGTFRHSAGAAGPSDASKVPLRQAARRKSSVELAARGLMDRKEPTKQAM